MATLTLNSYSLTYKNNTKRSCVAASMEDAAKLLDTEEGNPGSTLLLEAMGIMVDTPIPLVKFETKVEPEAAATVGCIATPITYVVPAGTKVIFTAIAVPGYTFKEWTLNGTSVSTDAVAELTIQPDTPSSEWEEYSAVFEPAP